MGAWRLELPCCGLRVGWITAGWVGSSRVRWESGGSGEDDDDILAGVWFVLMWACRGGSHLSLSLYRMEPTGEESCLFGLLLACLLARLRCWCWVGWVPFRSPLSCFLSEVDIARAGGSWIWQACVLRGVAVHWCAYGRRDLIKLLNQMERATAATRIQIQREREERESACGLILPNEPSITSTCVCGREKFPWKFLHIQQFC